MKPFEKFKKKHGKPEKCEKVDVAAMSNYKEIFSAEFLDEWANSGWCSYGKGLIWTVNPLDYEEILENWLENSTNSFAFARTAFGGIFFRHNSENFYLDVLNKDISEVFPRLDFVFDGTLCDNGYLKNVLLKPLFEEALKELGSLEKDQCFGVFPPLELGGEVIFENLKKVKIREYLALLSDI